MLIESPQNPRARAWKKLQSRKGRDAMGQFLAEGWHLAEEAAAAGALDELILESGREISPKLRAHNPPIVEVTPKVMKYLADASTPQGVAAVCRLPRADDFAPGPGRTLLLDGIQDPGNVGTILRMAAAAGWNGAVLGPGTADPFSPKALRASQGAVFHLRLAFSGLEAWIDALRGQSVPVLATAAGESAVDYRTVQPRESMALVLGNEGAGIREEILERCDATVRIPLPGRAESLSVPVAAGVLIFHFT